VRTTPGPNILSRPGPCLGRAPHVGDLSESAHPAITLSTFTHSMRTRSNAVKFSHQFLCSPKVSSLLKAVHCGFLNGCPNMSVKLILKYLNPSAATAKGHMKCPRHGIRNTRTRTPVKTNDPHVQVEPVPVILQFVPVILSFPPEYQPLPSGVQTSLPTTRNSPSQTFSALGHSARQWQVRRLLTKVVAKFMSYDLQTSCLQKPENLRIV
jgi:hypothetical protein